MKKSTMLLVLAVFAGGIVTGKAVTKDVVNSINPFHEAEYDCRYSYYLPNALRQDRWTTATKTEIQELKSGKFFDGLKVVAVLPLDKDYTVFAVNEADDNITVNCKVQ